MKMARLMIRMQRKQRKNERRRRRTKVKRFSLISHKEIFDLAQTATTDGQTEVDAIPNGTEAIATLTLQADGRFSSKKTNFIPILFEFR